MRVVTNTSPLVYLFQAGALDLLPELYGRVVVPRAVVDELTVGRSEGHDVPDCLAESWMDIESIAIPSVLSLITALGLGEAEAIALALSVPADLVILDDALARRIARTRGVRVTGTLGILIEAKSQGLLDSVMPLVTRLRARGFYVTPEVEATIARLAGESVSSGGE